MTDTVYPPDHLLRKWESLIIDEEQNVDVVLYEAFQAGADQELEACCEWVKAKEWIHAEFSDELRAFRRPKPPSLREQALEQLDSLHSDLKLHGLGTNTDTIRRALESLPS